MLTYAYILFQPFSPRLTEPIYSTLTRQLEAVIIEVSMVRALRLRTNQWQVHEAKHLPPTKVTYNGQGSYFNMKVLVFAEPGHMQFFFLTPAT